jgi:hypothetical protein
MMAMLKLPIEAVMIHVKAIVDGGHDVRHRLLRAWPDDKVAKTSHGMSP